MSALTDRPAALTKGEQKRAVIIDAALALFEERGFEASTMRAIAERAEVSVGNAYYYFDSKEALIQAFYDRAAAEHQRRADVELDGVTDLMERATLNLLAWVDEMSGFHEFAGVFLRTASDPSSPLSPFSNESAPARELAIDGWRRVVDGAEIELSDEVSGELPQLLWLFQMGVVLFWVHDRSEATAATRLLIERTVPLLIRGVEFSALPIVREVVTDLVGLIGDLRSMQAAATGPSTGVIES
ncbi:MAG: TetR/AcrR family transcriptional regulator [Ilumatobacter sp.]